MTWGVQKENYVVSDLPQAAALLEPTRLRLLAGLREPDSATGLAKRLGLPRQRVNYHLRELEAAGLIRLVRENRKGNCTERIVEAIARSFALDPALLGDAARPAVLVEVKVRVANDADHAAFAEDLQNEVAKLAAEYHDETATRSVRVVINGYSA